MTIKKVVLKPGKDRAIKHRHHWIFSGAIASLPEFENGDILPVYNHSDELLGSAYFNRKSSIIGRMVSFDATPPLEAITQSIDQAIAMRRTLFDPSITNAFRLINGEGDCLPGLIVDQYNDVLVLQITTMGMDKLRPWLCELLDTKLKPKAIFEKSIVPSRKEEGLKDIQGWIKGEPTQEIIILENKLKFIVNPEEGQKTGFFLDHREMRQLIGSLSSNKRVLNCFSYTGGFSVYALAGGAKCVDSVDISSQAIQLAKRNVQLNGFPEQDQGFYTDDVFKFLREQNLNYDLVILDPPAFAKKQKDIVPACRGYKDINRVTMQKMPPQSILLTCSCSYHVDESLFQKVVFQAACEAKRNVKIIRRHLLALDHPINIFHPEGDYLKSLLLYIE